MKPNYSKLSPAILKRLQSAYDSATLAERASGLEWYAKANAYAADLARRYGYSVAQVSAVLAALSPGSEWTRNILDAETLLDHVARGVDVPVLGVYGRRNVDKALAALAVSDPLALFSAKTGPKTSAFYLAICDASTCAVDASDKVVIDRHAASAALGKRGARGGSAIDVVPPALYRWLAAHYVELAKRVGVDPWQAQAVIWNSWRRPVPGTKYEIF